MMSSRDDVELMILSDLSALCKKLAENPVVPKKLRSEALGCVDDYNSLLPYRGTDREAHFEREQLVFRITAFLPNIAGAIDAESVPE
jgi:hypothetical protein